MLSSTTDFSNARRAKRAVGALFFIAFGAAWLALGASDFLPRASSVYLLIGAPALVFLVAALRIRHVALTRAGGPIPKTPADKQRDLWFHAVNGGQWVLIFICATILANLGLREWTLPMVIFIIGLHFFPLARLFDAPSHNVSGLALVVIACAYPFVAPGGPTSGLGPVLAGLTLWVSAGWALRPPELPIAANDFR